MPDGEGRAVRLEALLVQQALLLRLVHGRLVAVAFGGFLDRAGLIDLGALGGEQLGW
ncbi:hypothetical protein [Deinococcus sp. LM3]|uniref:hypothetical protein n=1 Tax=Deinococcus sp. LM3 TaxID=1938608 RepID=UPI00143C0728|nr:hypothetical protein [Deinococcus sp. LM3]